MTFVSYAQNYEDVMLHRALNHVENGFYVDVGANDPVVDSVTKAFYERGWRGINIEPVRHWHDKLLVDRPEDINLNIAISDQPGVMRLYDVQDTGLSTSHKDFAEKHSKELGFQYQEIMVPALTLDSVLKEFNREIHFLKVDVEGAEKQVLASIDLTRTRPWIILVEATKPFSQEQNYEDWDALLINRGYAFVYFDGLNRFYIPAERNDLLIAFSSPPNFFDNFIRFSEWNTQLSLKSSEEKREQLENALNNNEEKREQLENALNDKEQERLQLETALSSCESSLNSSKQALSSEIQNSKLEQERLGQLLNSSQERVKKFESYATKQKNEIQHWVDEDNRHQVELKSVYSSTSWRITAPVRKISDFGRGIIPLRTLPKRATLKIIRSISIWIIVHPNVDRVAISMVNRFPALKSRLKRVVYGVTPLLTELAADEKHFFELFQHELFHRQEGKAGTQ